MVQCSLTRALTQYFFQQESFNTLSLLLLLLLKYVKQYALHKHRINLRNEVFAFHCYTGAKIEDLR